MPGMIMVMGNNGLIVFHYFSFFVFSVKNEIRILNFNERRTREN